jgi:hypothetical protein
MNHSMHSADRATHLKIVVAALIAAIGMTCIALSSHLRPESTELAVIKAGKPVAMTNAATTLTR